MFSFCDVYDWRHRTCDDNLDKTFADCSVPQEKSDHAINIELELSDCDEDVDEVSEATTLKKSQPIGMHTIISLFSSVQFI